MGFTLTFTLVLIVAVVASAHFRHTLNQSTTPKARAQIYLDLSATRNARAILLGLLLLTSFGAAIFTTAVFRQGLYSSGDDQSSAPFTQTDWYCMDDGSGTCDFPQSRVQTPGFTLADVDAGLFWVVFMWMIFIAVVILLIVQLVARPWKPYDETLEGIEDDYEAQIEALRQKQPKRPSRQRAKPSPEGKAETQATADDTATPQA